MEKNKTEEIEFIIDENNRVDFRQVLQMINMYEEKIQKKQAIIDRAINFTNKKWGTWCTHHIEYMTELQDILKEAQNEKN